MTTLLPNLINDGTISYIDGSASFIKTKLKYMNDELYDLSTIVEHSTNIDDNGNIAQVSLLKCKSSQPLARIHFSVEPESVYIEGFYVYPQTQYCKMNPDERDAYKKLGELIFSIGFKHILNYYKSKSIDIRKVNVSAQVFGDKYDHTDVYDHSNMCILLDKVYRLKYNFKEVQFDTDPFTILDQSKIDLCKKKIPHYVSVKSSFLDIVSNLIKFEPVFELYKFRNT